MTIQPIKIEKGIPMPSYGPRSRAVYPFDALKVGDSFHVAIANGQNPMALQRNLCTYKTHFRPKKFATRKEGSGYRVWRTE